MKKQSVRRPIPVDTMRFTETGESACAGEKEGSFGRLQIKRQTILLGRDRVRGGGGYCGRCAVVYAAYGLSRIFYTISPGRGARYYVPRWPLVWRNNVRQPVAGS